MKNLLLKKNLLREKGIPIYMKKMRIIETAYKFIPTYFYKAVKKY